jgi:hypothetical protein
LSSTCLSRVGSPTPIGGECSSSSNGEPEPALAGLRRQQRAHLLQEAGDREVDPLELEPAGLDAREVEDVVDDREQVPPRGADRGHVALLLGLERLGREQVGHAEHAGQRRPDLVAHRRQELGLRRPGRLGPLPLPLRLAPGRLGRLPGLAEAGDQRLALRQDGRHGRLESRTATR